MGAGSFPAGTGPAGFDPAVTVASTATGTLPTAWFYDPNTRTFPFASDGSALATHPVDQSVCIALGVPLSGAAPAPNTGLDMQRIRNATPASLAKVVVDVVSVALSAQLAAGDIALLGAKLDPDSHGRAFFTVSYLNLRLPATPTPAQRSLTFPAA